MCPSGADCMFQWVSTIKTQLGMLFSPWYSWKIAELALNNNHLLILYKYYYNMNIDLHIPGESGGWWIISVLLSAIVHAMFTTKQYRNIISNVDFCYIYIYYFILQLFYLSSQNALTVYLQVINSHWPFITLAGHAYLTKISWGLLWVTNFWNNLNIGSNIH